ncbi:MAG TPA: DnaB-like helicase N-terminal domain-containing protein, partial [Candidatus Gracilibacteria bacterium]|nr:DnaB-like helicase N-terminal domain-containing protein [Candidatus Gracilibacteria bacterium]
MEEGLLKAPPHSLDVERSVLGSILIDKEAISKIADFLLPEDFYHDSHALIYQAIFDLYDRRHPVDVITLSNLLEERKQLEQIGGSSYLASLANEVPTASHVFEYAMIVKS